MINKTAFLRDADVYRSIPQHQRFFLDTIIPIHLFQQFGTGKVCLLKSRDSQKPMVLDPYSYFREANEQFRFQNASSVTSFEGDIDACTSIRTLVVNEGTVNVRSAAGIIADSQLLTEWQKTQNKIKTLIRTAIEEAEEIFAVTKEDQVHA